MFHSKDVYPDPELIEKLNHIFKSAWKRRVIKIGIEAVSRVQDFKIFQEGHLFEKPSLFLLEKVVRSVTYFGPYLLTDEVALPWMFTAKEFSLANVWFSSRVTLEALARRFFA